MALEFDCIQVRQPIGDFFLTSLPASLVARRVSIAPRTMSSAEAEEVQREASDKRIREIANYVRDPDATFPTAVIVCCRSDNTTIENGRVKFARGHEDDQDSFIGELLDGQHRIKGLRLAAEEGVDIGRFDLPAVVMMDLQPAQKAYVFSIINSKQTPVSKSLIYDLFGLSKVRSPYLTCHEIARAMNTQEGGPFARGLKMLGKKQAETELLTQGSFVRNLLSLITSRPDEDALALKSGELVRESDKPFNAFFLNNKDELILQAMTNYFSAVRDVFPEQWNYRSYINEDGKPRDPPTPILRKTVGYEALMRALTLVWPEVKERGSVSYEVFRPIVERFKAHTDGVLLDSTTFGSSGGSASRLAQLLVHGPERRRLFNPH